MLINLIFLLAAVIFLHALKQRHIQLGYRVLFSLALGTVYGLLLKSLHEATLANGIHAALYFIGQGYLSLLKMLVIPLILTSIIHAILNLATQNGSAMKRMSFLSCGMLLGMTALASLIGILIGYIFSVGQGLELPQLIASPKHTYTGLVNTLLAMLPNNPLLAMTQENTVAIVIFAILLGLAARFLDEKDHDKMETFKQLIASLFAIIKKLASLVLGFTPYGVFALMTLLIVDQGISLFSSMLNFICAMYVAMILVFLMHILFLILSGRNPWIFFKNAYTPLFVAFTTRSSFGTLPVTEETLRNKFKTTQVTATFVPSLGATIGMNACAGVFPAMLVVMTLNILHQPLTLGLVLSVMFINTIASLGISGIPGTAYIAATVTLTSLNLPYAIIALVQGIDPLIDMGRTATNVNGVLTTALIVDRFSHEKEIMGVTPPQHEP